MKLNTTVGIAIGLVVAVGLVAALLAVVKPSAKSAASAWKKAEGAKLLDEKRDVERTLARNNLLWEIAVTAKKSGPDSVAAMEAVNALLVVDSTGYPKATAEGSKITVGWPDRAIVLEFNNRLMTGVDASALVAE